MKKYSIIAFIIVGMLIVTISRYTYKNYRYYSVMEGNSIDQAVGCDFIFYYEAGRGNFDYTVRREYDGQMFDFRFFYPKATAICWYWCRWCDYESAYAYWTAFLTICYLIIVWKGCQYGFGGIVTALAGIKWFTLCIANGNIIPALCLFILTAWGCVLAGSFKFFPIAFLGFHFLNWTAETSSRSGDREAARSSLSRSSCIVVDYVIPAAFFLASYWHYFAITYIGQPDEAWLIHFWR